MPLELLEKTFVNSHDYGVGYWWLDGLTFKASDYRDEREVLKALLDDPWYRHDYCSPRKDAPTPDYQLHGPYRLDEITVDSFDSRTRDEVVDDLNDWLEVGGSTPETTAAFHAAIRELIRTGEHFYRLRDLGEDAQHDYGSVVGTDTGFNEFISIADDLSSVSLIVGTDD